MNCRRLCDVGLGLPRLAALLIVGLVAGCASSPQPSSPVSSSSRYSMVHDAYPDEDMDVSHVADAVPRWEPYSRGGNKSPYTVWGKQYYVLPTAEGYRERGVASWYGKKFHGHATSNGETYDMYGMTAAHRSLPIPSYARVTNLGNGRSVIVRVNDRGPFHGNRLIDLSYAAAKKLGYVNQGTAEVEVEAIYLRQGEVYRPGATPAIVVAASHQTTAAVGDVISADGFGWFIQVGAFSSQDSAERLKSRIREAVTVPVFVNRTQASGALLHRVQVGPFESEADALQHRARIEDAAASKVMIIRGPVSMEGAG